MTKYGYRYPKEMGGTTFNIPENIRPLREIPDLIIHPTDLLNFTEELIAFNSNMVSIGFIRIMIDRTPEGFFVDTRSEMCDQYIPVDNVNLSNMSLPHSEYEKRLCRERNPLTGVQELRTQAQDVKTDLWQFESHTGGRNTIGSSTKRNFDASINSKSERIVPVKADSSSTSTKETQQPAVTATFSEEEAVQEEWLENMEEVSYESMSDVLGPEFPPLRSTKSFKKSTIPILLDESASFDQLDKVCPKVECVLERKQICTDKKPCPNKLSDLYNFFDKKFFKRTLVEDRLKEMIEKQITGEIPQEHVAGDEHIDVISDANHESIQNISTIESDLIVPQASNREQKLDGEMNTKLSDQEKKIPKKEFKKSKTNDELLRARILGFSKDDVSTTQPVEELSLHYPSLSMIPLKSSSGGGILNEIDGVSLYKEGPKKDNNLSFVGEVLERSHEDINVSIKGTEPQVLSKVVPDDSAKFSALTENMLTDIAEKERKDDTLAQPAIDPCPDSKWTRMKPCKRHAQELKVCNEEKKEPPKAPIPIVSSARIPSPKKYVEEELTSDNSTMSSALSESSMVSASYQRHRRRRVPAPEVKKESTRDFKTNGKDLREGDERSCSSKKFKHHVCHSIKFRHPKPCPPTTEICTKYFKKKEKLEDLDKEELDARVAHLIGRHFSGEKDIYGEHEMWAGSEVADKLQDQEILPPDDQATPEDEGKPKELDNYDSASTDLSSTVSDLDSADDFEYLELEEDDFEDISNRAGKDKKKHKRVVIKTRPTKSKVKKKPPCYQWRDRVSPTLGDSFKEWVESGRTKTCPLNLFSPTKVTEQIDKKINKCTAFQEKIHKRMQELSAVSSEEEQSFDYNLSDQADIEEEEAPGSLDVIKDKSESTISTNATNSTIGTITNPTKIKMGSMKILSTSIQKIHKPVPSKIAHESLGIRRTKYDTSHSRVDVREQLQPAEEEPEKLRKKKLCCKHGTKCDCYKSEKVVGVNESENNSEGVNDLTFPNVQQVYYFEVIHDKDKVARKDHNESPSRKSNKKSHKRKDPCATVQKLRERWRKFRHVIPGFCPDSSLDIDEKPDYHLSIDSSRMVSLSMKDIAKSRSVLRKDIDKRKRKDTRQTGKDNLDSTVIETAHTVQDKSRTPMKKARGRRSKMKSCNVSSSSGFTGDDEINEMLEKAMTRLKDLEDWKIPKAACRGLAKNYPLCPLYEKLQRLKETGKTSILSRADLLRDREYSMYSEIIRDDWGEMEPYFHIEKMQEEIVSSERSSDTDEIDASDVESVKEETEEKTTISSTVTLPSKSERSVKFVELTPDKSFSVATAHSEMKQKSEFRDMKQKSEIRDMKQRSDIRDTKKAEIVEIEEETIKIEPQEQDVASGAVPAEVPEMKSDFFGIKGSIQEEHMSMGEETMTFTLGLESLRSLIKEKKSLTEKISKRVETVSKRASLKKASVQKNDYTKKFVETMKETCEQRKRNKLCFLNACRYKALHKTCSETLKEQMNQIMQNYYDELKAISSEEVVVKPPPKLQKAYSWISKPRFVSQSIMATSLSSTSIMSGDKTKKKRVQKHKKEVHVEKRDIPSFLELKPLLMPLVDKEDGFECFQKFYPHLSPSEIEKLMKSKGGSAELMHHTRHLMPKKTRQIHRDPCQVTRKSTKGDVDLRLQDEDFIEEEFIGESLEEIGEMITDESVPESSEVDEPKTPKETAKEEISFASVIQSKVFSDTKKIDEEDTVIETFWDEERPYEDFYDFHPYEDYVPPEYGLTLDQYKGAYTYPSEKTTAEFKCKIHHVCRKNPCKVHVCISRLKLCSGPKEKKAVVEEGKEGKKTHSVSALGRKDSQKRVTIDDTDILVTEVPPETSLKAKSATSFFGQTILMSISAVVDVNFSVFRERRFEYEERFNGRWENILHTIRTRGILYYLHTPKPVINEPRIQKYHKDLEKDIITESANLLLMRKIALSSFHGKFRTLAQLVDGRVTDCIYYVGPRVVRVIRNQRIYMLKITRFISHPDRPMSKSFSILTTTGKLVKCWWNDAPYQLITNPRYFLNEETFKDRPIPLNVYDEVTEVREFFIKGVRAQTLKYEEYIKKHPQIMSMIHYFVRYLLLQKPEKIVPFALCYFSALPGLFKDGIPPSFIPGRNQK